ncbi:GntR family transcriptional regulator [Mangrovicella endophytica]|uniref:GntR family transcriptional regulator n=1 Tax=Mangrovicella endophytica TaxID=2066697 RepID=UPI000C9E258A|nr:GntR family transcriptional regulator [Mangrovicella endophytica]
MARAYDTAYRTIKHWIQEGEIPPGGLIDENETARKLETSRTPVREALLRLQSEGFIEIARGKGIRVLPLSSADMREIYQVISGLEVVAVSLLARKRPSSEEVEPLFRATREMEEALARQDVNGWGKADETFHRELLRLSGNRKLYEVGCQMRDFVLRAHMVALRLQTDEYRQRSTANHAELIIAILTRNSQTVADAHFAQRLRGEDALIAVVEKFKVASL